MNIITISREFGSGGRELGKRLADFIGYNYYDNEILSAIAAKKEMDENYVDHALNQHEFSNMPLHFGRSFSVSSNAKVKVDLMVEQKKIIEKIAAAGENCIIVGRNADVILQQHHPLSLFVCAPLEQRINRCISRAKNDEQFTSREIARQIKRVDVSRKATRRILTDSEWGNPADYHLVVNTADWDIRELAPVIAHFAEEFFRRKKSNGNTTF